MNDSFRRRAEQTKLTLFMSTSYFCSLTCESLSYEFELLAQIYIIPLSSSFDARVSLLLRGLMRLRHKTRKNPRYKQTAEVIYSIYSNMVIGSLFFS